MCYQSINQSINQSHTEENLLSTFVDFDHSSYLQDECKYEKDMSQLHINKMLYSKYRPCEYTYYCKLNLKVR